MQELLYNGLNLGTWLNMHWSLSSSEKNTALVVKQVLVSIYLHDDYFVCLLTLAEGRFVCRQVVHEVCLCCHNEKHKGETSW